MPEGAVDTPPFDFPVYPARFASTTALSDSITLTKPNPPTPTPPATVPPESPVQPPTKPPVLPAAGEGDVVGVPLLGLPGLVMVVGLLMGVGWRSLRVSAHARKAVAAALVLGAAALAAWSDRHAEAQF